MMNRYWKAFERLTGIMPQLAKSLHVSKIRLYLDAAYCYVRYGVTPNEYVGFDFYKYNHFYRHLFYTARYSYRYEKKLNDPKYKCCFDNKAEFNRLFRDFVRRDWIFTKESSLTELDQFIKSHEKIIVKPIGLSSGRGIHVLKSDESMESLLAEDYLLEDFIVQHSSMLEVNPSSVNSIRMYTMLSGCNLSSFNIISATLRAGGKGAEVDNFHAGGVNYPIDIKTGVIYQSGSNIMGRKFIFHPSTGKKMVGFEVPNWNLLCDFVEKASKIIPRARFVAWDIAVLPDGFEMIEGNYEGDPGVMQNAMKEGVLYKIMDLYKCKNGGEN